MNSKTNKQPSTVSTSSQTNQTVPSFNTQSLKAATFKTLALKIRNEINTGTLSPSTRRAFSKYCITSCFSTQKRSHLNNITDFKYRDLPLQIAKQTQAMYLSSTTLPSN